MPRTRPPYPEEFRHEAIRLAQLGDKPQRKLAKDLGISDVTLRNWLKQEKAERGERPGGLSSEEREELQRLRDENAKLRMEREILRKADVLCQPLGLNSGWRLAVKRFALGPAGRPSGDSGAGHPLGSSPGCCAGHVCLRCSAAIGGPR